MEPESLDRLKSILDRAAELPAAEREALLDRECAGDAEIRARIERLLESHDAAGGFLPPAPPAPEEPHPAAGAAGREIGPYRLIEPIGEGGFGSVWLAEQSHPIRRRVALKLLHAGTRSADVLARFQAERQVLALMGHPNIAAVHDAGIMDDGAPFFVMEHVPGIPVTAYADEHKLGLEARMRLFLQLCDAVRHAHEKGVIHRDLKPSNVLVTRVGDRPLVKVIDFGVAKAMGEGLTPETLRTEAGVVVGTPEYMSPEQAAAVPGGVDTRSDVYSLGAILYELLVGSLPFARADVPESGVLGLLQRIRDREPPRPTSRLRSMGAAAEAVAARRCLNVPSLSRRLRGDVEWITLKALEKDPARRYSGAAMLAEDVERHLAGLPILARSPSTAYQVRKLVTRHRAVSVLAGMLVTALLVSTSALTVMYHRQGAERRKAEHINAFLQEMLSASDPAIARGEQVLARSVLDRAAEKVSGELADDPELQIAVLGTLSEAYSGLGMPAEALSLARSAVPIAERLHGRRSVERALALRSFGELLRAEGHADSAEVALTEALTILRDRRSPPIERGRTLNDLALAVRELGRYEECERHYREALELVETGVGRDDPEYATVLNGLALLLSQEGRLDEAEVAQREALAIHTAASGADHPDAITNMNNLGLLLRRQHRYAEAESVYRATIVVEKRVLGDSHPILAMGLNNLAVLLNNVGRAEEAEPLQEECLAIRRRVYGNEHPAVASALNNLAALYNGEGRSAEAEPLYQEALAIRVKLYGEDHADVATVRHNLAALLSVSKPREAEEQVRRALEVRRARLGPAHSQTVASCHLLAEILMETGRVPEASRLMEETLAAQAAFRDADPMQLPWTRSLLGQCLLGEGRAAAAETLLVDSLEPLLADEATARDRKATALRAAIEVLRACGRPDEADGLQSRLDNLP